MHISHDAVTRARNDNQTFKERKEEGKYQELIQSSTTPDPGHHMGK